MYNPLCNFAFKYLGDEEASEDVVQEVFVHLWEKRKKLEINSSLKSYLFSSVKNKSIEKLRRLKVEKKYLQSSDVPLFTETNVDFEDEMQKAILKDNIYQSVDKLPKKCKIIFKMAKFDGLTYKEIADELNLSEKTIESQMRRAFIMLREMLG